MDRGASDGSCYYAVLGVRKNASFSEIRSAYRKLALRWHPDRWTKDSTVAGDVKRRFQQIQEAYSVLSDDGKRRMYDAGMYDPFEEEDEEFSDFMQEMLSMMDKVSSENESFEDLQKMFVDIVREEGDQLGCEGSRLSFNSSEKAGGVSSSQGNGHKRGQVSGKCYQVR